MTKERDLEDLQQITQAHYEKCQQSFAKIVTQENKLREELARLDALNRSARPPEPTLTHRNAIGADVIWQGWLGRAKTALNLKLAQVLATKEYHLIQVRRAYGKVLVLQEMQQKQRNIARKFESEKLLGEAIVQAIQNPQ